MVVLDAGSTGTRIHATHPDPTGQSMEILERSSYDKRDVTVVTSDDSNRSHITHGSMYFASRVTPATTFYNEAISRCCTAVPAVSVPDGLDLFNNFCV